MLLSPNAFKPPLPPLLAYCYYMLASARKRRTSEDEEEELGHGEQSSERRPHKDAAPPHEEVCVCARARACVREYVRVLACVQWALSAVIITSMQTYSRDSARTGAYGCPSRREFQQDFLRHLIESKREFSRALK